MRWLRLWSLGVLCGCYAVPSQHKVAPEPDADVEQDGETEPDASPEEDAEVGEGDVDSGTPRDGGLDARVDGGRDGAAEAGSEGGPSDAGPQAEASACGMCSDAAPLCATNGKCVQCTGEDAGCASGQHCTNAGACVACLENAHCTSADASVCSVGSGSCVPCMEGNDQQCAHIAGKGVCSTGQCVQCRKDKAAACGVSGTQYVCDPTTRACDVNRKTRSKTLCNVCVSPDDTGCRAKQDCVSDDECQTGQACVDVPAGAGKKVCQQVLGINSCPDPYTSVTAASVTSADGPSVRVCTFATATTCLAHAHYRVQRCGMKNPSNEAEDVPGTGDDIRCGEPNLADGYCTYSDAFKQYLCTVPCNASNRDCPNAALCDTVPTPDRCAL